MCEAVGHPVRELTRTRIGPLTDRRLKPGTWRDLTRRRGYDAAGFGESSCADAVLLVALVQRQHVLGGVCSMRPAGGSKPSASAMSSIFGQVVQVLQAEADQELLRRRVDERPAHHVLAADDLDQVPLEQRRQHARGVDAADLADLERGDRLLVGDHRQRLEAGDGELRRRRSWNSRRTQSLQLGPRDDLVAAGHFHHLQPGTVLVVGLQRLDRRQHVFLRLLRQEAAEPLAA